MEPQVDSSAKAENEMKMSMLATWGPTRSTSTQSDTGSPVRTWKGLEVCDYVEAGGHTMRLVRRLVR